ncbi:pyruvate carboxylase [Rhodocyclus tenuis]|uniref:Pyruvate carboxylase n=1 Tax=Rhodocyclus gracilis TaxID=2929842 RepID=A0ABX0WI91_9RHOO|nr:pyruvate carboxylase [Rhodocyclus gracilis]NJA88264.1 pyruvate carboxylase [Rhodocyclus gracilis]
MSLACAPVRLIPSFAGKLTNCFAPACRRRAALAHRRPNLHPGGVTHVDIRKILIANRSEIAIRVMRAATELGIRTVGIYSNEDRFALHRFKADESYLVGAGKKPISAYLDIDDIIRIAKATKVDAIHPGYGLLSENPDFAEACAKNGIAFIGPTPEVMRTLGNKVAARNAAVAAGVPVMPATGPLPADFAEAAKLAAEIGYPLMLKASWGGGGRGMRVIESEADLAALLDVARREAGAAFGNDEVYLEKLVRNARHVEVQILGDRHQQAVHLFERDCSVQRRNQKVVERAPAPYLDAAGRDELCSAALKLARAVNYTHAGTVEFLMDGDTGKFYFIEVNPRIQVEHTVTEQVTGIDIVKAQIHITEGAKIGTPESGVPAQADIHLNGYALQCRVTTEDPENNFTPDYGKIATYRSAAGFGIRLDAGTAYAGAVITPYYDSLLVKVTAWAPSSGEAIHRMDRALREFRVRGLATNLHFLENVINHPAFISGECSTRFIDTTPELFHFPKRRDRATRLLRFVGDVIVNGNDEMKGRTLPKLPLSASLLPATDLAIAPPPGSRDRLKELGARGFAEWMRNEERILITDTTMRDAHQSLFATRMRTADMLAIAPHYARQLPELFSLECWGGATFDVAMRFLKEDPWERLHKLRQAAPNILFQMLLRASNAVGYTNYADNVVRQFVQQAAKEGIDVFRVFDSLNWVDNMRVAMDAVQESGALCEAAICYTGDIFDSSRPKYNLKYYVDMAKQLEKAGAHILGIKDMAGVCRPRAARALVKALKEEVGLPIHFHTHDTSGGSIASVLAMVEAGVDAVDGAMDSMSGLTSQPSLGALVAALEGDPRSPGFTAQKLQPFARYWEGVRRYYAPFEADIRSGTSDVYRHEMPGGQYTNLREQARAMGLEHRWDEVSQGYADVNKLFGDIVKVTPSSKVVGDMALFMVANELTPADVADPVKEIAFPESVISLFRGEMGYPADGFPPALQAKVLKDRKPLPGRAGADIPPVDLEAARAQAEKRVDRQINDNDLASYLMYPKVFADFAEHQRHFGDVSLVPTPLFFYGMSAREEVTIEIDPGKALIVRLIGRTEPDEDGMVKLFFELNGQPRTVRVPKKGAVVSSHTAPKAEAGNPNHVAAPMPGMVGTVLVKAGQSVSKGSPLLSIEAMKMETMITAERDATVVRVHVASGSRIEAKDLLVELG